MARLGYIHDKLDIKFLVLYLMARVAAPVDFPTLTDLTMCDEGVDYFQFAEAVAELVGTGHLTLSEERYVITDKGRKNGGVCESSLPYSVRARCDRNLAALNAGLRRSAQVRSRITPREDGALTLTLELDDEGGNLLTVSLLTASPEQARELADRFQERPEQVYNRVLAALLDGGRKE